MKKLALVGKNISHSKSPEMYKKILGESIEYHLLDYPSELDIPKASELLTRFDGINITSPYKTHFVNQVELVGEAQIFKAINCLRKNQEGKIQGCNTDYLAIVEILKRHVKENPSLSVLILGDGVMAEVTKFALINLNIKFDQTSRKMSPNFSTLKLTDYLNQDKLLVINCCSRDYVYKENVSNRLIFWDYNYNFEQHKSLLASKCQYEDGIEMLFLQAEFAVAFWSNIKKF